MNLDLSGHQAAGITVAWHPAPPAAVPMVQFELPVIGTSFQPVAQSRASADPSEDDVVIARALAILESRLRKNSQAFSTPTEAKDYCRLQLGGLDHEVFGVIFLDAHHGMIEFRRMFNGTLTQTSVYPREVVKAALEVHAAAVILTHNHPSGSVEPSRADEMLTRTLKDALSLVDVRVMDHVVVSASGTCSLAERGLL